MNSKMVSNSFRRTFAIATLLFGLILARPAPAGRSSSDFEIGDVLTIDNVDPNAQDRILFNIIDPSDPGNPWTQCSTPWSDPKQASGEKVRLSEHAMFSHCETELDANLKPQSAKGECASRQFTYSVVDYRSLREFAIRLEFTPTGDKEPNSQTIFPFAPSAFSCTAVMNTDKTPESVNCRSTRKWRLEN